MIINAAAGGVPGILNKEKTVLLSAPNLEKWEDVFLKEALEKALDVPVRLENDAALGALGEAVFGAGKDKRIVAYFTVSTGVGGARVTDGRLDEGAFGFEPHRQIVDGIHKLRILYFRQWDKNDTVNRPRISKIPRCGKRRRGGWRSA